MKIDRLLVGAAVATLLASSAYAQSGSTAPSSSTAPPAAEPPAAADQTPASPAAGPATGAAAPGAPQTVIPSSASGNIMAELQSAGQFTTLVALLNQDGLASLVQAQPNLTLIAPTDAAFSALPPGQVDALKKDPSQLRALLSYHLIATKVTEAQVKGHAAGKVMTAAQKQVTVDGSSEPIHINDATVEQVAPASNGEIFVVDKVLTPMA